MALRAIQDFNLMSWLKQTAAGNPTVGNNDVVIVEKTVGQATAVVLPPATPTAGRACVFVIDSKGDAATNPITVSVAGGGTIRGSSSFVINQNFMAVCFMDTGTEWKPVFIGGGGAAGLPTSQFKTMNVTTGTLAANLASGAAQCYLLTTNATPGNQAMRTVAQVLADTPGLTVGMSYTLRITNSGAGTLTLTTDSGTQFTMTGTMTVATNTYRDFVITILTATTGTVQSVGTGPI